MRMAAGPEGSNSFHRSGSGEDSDTDYENENIRPRGLTGLQNLGNTCYLNSALQSLSNCPPLTRYFLDCPTLIRPEKSPMLSRSYLKLITELWHKKRPSYVVPSGVVSGIKAVHPMFRGYTQQDAQEFLRCFMDQLHEELKSPTLYSDEESDDEDSDDHRLAGENGNNSARLPSDGIHSRGFADQKNTVTEVVHRRPSFDSLSSQSELEYETCESGLSSERSSNASRDNGFSGDESHSDSPDLDRLRAPGQRTRKISAMSAGSGNEDYQPALDSVANTKEMKETANLLEKETELRRPRPKVGMEGGDCKEQGVPGPPYAGLAVGKEAEAGQGQGQAGSSAMPAPEPQLEVRSKSPVKQPSSSSTSKHRKRKNVRFDSIISQAFDGKILSSVRCLNCETVSTTKETFQDLSLPIPSKDHLHMLHSGGYHGVGGPGGVSPPKGGACGEVHQGWLASMFVWMKSWFIGPTITLQDCLSAFFSADELKGDNMYSCEKCKKLRNGLKYSKVLELPEVLSIHLKRFRHEFYSSKISTYISFPLEGLDMSPYVHKGCNNEVMLYDLVAIICHHGTAGGGHYTAYCLNYLNGQWYEFDDQYVTEVDVSQVQNCEAYVLFYKKSNKKIEATRQRVAELEADETSIMKFYISKQWISRFHTFAEPGPVTNIDFLCKHGGVPPAKVDMIDDLVFEVHQSTWELLYRTFGGGPVCNQLYACKTCHSELEKLRQRQHAEKEAFIQLNEEFQEEEHAASVYAISMAWFKEWESFVREKRDNPPEAIDNGRICLTRGGLPVLRQNSDYGHLSRDMWLFLFRIYGGGPEVVIRQSTGVSVKKGVTSAAAAAATATAAQQQPSPSSSSSTSAGGNSQPTLAALAARASSSSSSPRPPSPSSNVAGACHRGAGNNSNSPPPSSPPPSPSPPPFSTAAAPITTTAATTAVHAGTSPIASPSPSAPTATGASGGADIAVATATTASASSPRLAENSLPSPSSVASPQCMSASSSSSSSIPSPSSSVPALEPSEKGSDLRDPASETAGPAATYHDDVAVPSSSVSSSLSSSSSSSTNKSAGEANKSVGETNKSAGETNKIAGELMDPCDITNTVSGEDGESAVTSSTNVIESEMESGDKVEPSMKESRGGDEDGDGVVERRFENCSTAKTGSPSKSEAESLPSSESLKSSAPASHSSNLQNTREAEDEGRGDSAKEVSSLSSSSSSFSHQVSSHEIQTRSKAAATSASKSDDNLMRSSTDSGVSVTSGKNGDWDSVVAEGKGGGNEKQPVEGIPGSIESSKRNSKEDTVLNSPSPHPQQQKQNHAKSKAKHKKGKQMNVTRI